MTTEQFTVPIPKMFREDPEAKEWAVRLTLFLDDISRANGVLDTSTQTTATVLTQQEKLDLITVITAVDLNAMKDAQDALRNSLPAYTVTAATTDRSISANDAAGAISATPTQAEVENIRDALLKLADNVATLVNDLAAKDVVAS